MSARHTIQRDSTNLDIVLIYKVTQTIERTLRFERMAAFVLVSVESSEGVDVWFEGLWNDSKVANQDLQVVVSYSCSD